MTETAHSMGMGILTAAVCLALTPSAASAMPPGFADAVRRESIQAIAEMDGFDENKIWLAKAGIHIESLSETMLAQYEEPKVEGGTGRIKVSQAALESSWRSLRSQGVDDVSAARLAGWMLVPSLMHESQHAIQVDAMSRIGQSFYAVEAEVEADAVGMTAYLQILARFPEFGRHPFFIKSQNNTSLLSWRESFAAFRENIHKSYPRVPSALDGGMTSQLRIAEAVQEEMISDIDELLKNETEMEDRADLERRKAQAVGDLQTLRDASRREALLSYYRGLAASAERLWTVWDRLDPGRRLKRGPALTPEGIALTSLEAARGLIASSPVYYDREILKHLGAAGRAAAASGDRALRRQAHDELVNFKAALPAYARAVIRSNAAAATDAAKLESDLRDYLKTLRAKLSPAQYREADELVRAEILKVRSAPAAP